MKILIDINHPAHVHLFKNFAWEMQNKGHEILFTCRDKEFETYLLKTYNFNYKNFGKKYQGSFGKILGLLKFDFKEFITGLKFKPDIFLSHGSIYAAHAAFLLNKPHIALEDTYNKEQTRLYLPFTKYVLTSDYQHPFKNKKTLQYSGYHELAYLHPNRFTPDKNIYQELGLTMDERYVIVRFVSWEATHDIGHTGIFFENKINLVKKLEKLVKVFISSERELPDELKSYKLKIKPDRIHHAIAFASLVFGESSTMSEEAAMLGVPSIYLYNSSTYYTLHLEKDYGLMFNYSESKNDQLKAIDKAEEIVSNPNLLSEWKEKQKKMLSEKIDVTAFLIWFIENYPNSVNILKQDPNYQNNFK